MTITDDLLLKMGFQQKGNTFRLGNGAIGIIAQVTKKQPKGSSARYFMHDPEQNIASQLAEFEIFTTEALFINVKHQGRIEGKNEIRQEIRKTLALTD